MTAHRCARGHTCFVNRHARPSVQLLAQSATRRMQCSPVISRGTLLLSVHAKSTELTVRGSVLRNGHSLALYHGGKTRTSGKLAHATSCATSMIALTFTASAWNSLPACKASWQVRATGCVSSSLHTRLRHRPQAANVRRQSCAGVLKQV